MTDTSSASKPPTFHSLPRWVAGLDALIVGLLALSLPGQGGFVWDADAPYSLPEQQALFWVPRLMDSVVAASALVGLLVPAVRQWRWQRGAQRVLFDALLVRISFVLMELSLPSEGGAGGFVLLLALPVLAGTCSQIKAALFLRQKVCQAVKMGMS